MISRNELKMLLPALFVSLCLFAAPVYSAPLVALSCPDLIEGYVTDNGKVSLERLHLLNRMNRTFMAGILLTDPNYAKLNQEKREIARFILSDEQTLSLFNQFYTLNKKGGLGRERKQVLAREITQKILGKVRPELTSAEDIGHHVDPSYGSSSKNPIYEALAKFSSTPEKWIPLEEASHPKEFKAKANAPAGLNETTQIYVRIGEKLIGFPMLILEANKIVTVKHAWDYWLGINKGEPLELYIKRGDEQISIPYRVLKTGTAAPDANDLPTEAASEDLILLQSNLPLAAAETAGAKIGDTLHAFVSPKAHVMLKLPEQGTGLTFYTSGPVQKNVAGLLVADMLSHTGTSGTPVLNGKGEVTGLIWGNRTFRRENNRDNLTRTLYFNNDLIVEREITYIIPIQTILAWSDWH